MITAIAPSPAAQGHHAVVAPSLVVAGTSEADVALVSGAGVSLAASGAALGAGSGTGNALGVGVVSGAGVADAAGVATATGAATGGLGCAAGRRVGAARLGVTWGSTTAGVPAWGSGTSVDAAGAAGLIAGAGVGELSVGSDGVGTAETMGCVGAACGVAWEAVCAKAMAGMASRAPLTSRVRVDARRMEMPRMAWPELPRLKMCRLYGMIGTGPVPRPLWPDTAGGR